MIQHPYCYPGSDIYRNRLNIRGRDDLDQFERWESAWRMEVRPCPAALTPTGYRSTHRFLFRNIYDWAGKYRYVDTGRGAPFCKAEFIEGEMKRRFAMIRAEKFLRGQIGRAHV